MASDTPAQTNSFTTEEQRGLYRAIYSRRDIRTFKSDPIPPEVLARIIRAAHHGPSVGFMQPWDFIMVRDMNIRQKVKDLFERRRRHRVGGIPPAKNGWRDSGPQLRRHVVLARPSMIH